MLLQKKETLNIVYKNGTKDLFEANVAVKPFLKELPTTTLTNKDVINAQIITFYGFDFTNFKLIEFKRLYESKKSGIFIFLNGINM